MGSSTKKIAIIGKNGFIGSHLYNYLSSFDNYDIVAPNHSNLDITNEITIKDFLSNNRLDVIILLAGSKNVKELEKNPDFGYLINVKPVEYFIKYITKEKFIYFSSDYVFSGDCGNYKTTDKVNPLSIYGKNKVQAEKLLEGSSINYSIVRTAAVLGKGSVFLSWLIETLQKDREVEMFENSYFSPTCVKFLCEMVEKIINDNSQKIYHVVEEERLSRYELACLIKKIINSKCEIIPKKTSYIDRTLLQDDFVRNNTIKKFEDYLKDELCIN